MLNILIFMIDLFLSIIKKIIFIFIDLNLSILLIRS